MRAIRKFIARAFIAAAFPIVVVAAVLARMTTEARSAFFLAYCDVREEYDVMKRHWRKGSIR